MLQPLNFPDEEGVAYVYHININTNYNSDAEQRACKSAMAASSNI